MGSVGTGWRAHGFDGEPDDLLRQESIVAAWLSHATQQPDSIAFLDERGRTITHGELASQTAQIAHWFTSEAGPNLTVGDRAVMSCEPSIDLIVAHIGALRAGLIVVPVNTSFTSVELANIAQESEAKVLLLSDPTRFTASTASTASTRVLRPEELLTTSLTTSNAHTNAHTLPHLRASDPALLIFTSGTTGKPKGALLSHGNIIASACALQLAWEWTATDRLVLALPLFHMHGLGVGVHGTLASGASAIVVAKFSPEAVFDAAHAHRGTMLFGVPTMWVRILDHPRVGELRTLRLCVSGSAALSPEVWTGLRERGGQEIVERYGMSETVMNISNPFRGERRPGSVGLPLPGVTMRLLDQGSDGVGEIGLRGPNVFAGYWNRPDANADAFTTDGWFRTGDLGRVDPDGYVSIVGRSKDLIITGGYNVYPRDVEEILRTHPSVADAAVVGEPSAEWGETVTACVVADGECDPVELLQFAAAHLAPYQKPRRVVVLQEFPRNALGKVVKADLLRIIENL